MCLWFSKLPENYRRNEDIHFVSYWCRDLRSLRPEVPNGAILLNCLLLKNSDLGKCFAELCPVNCPAVVGLEFGHELGCDS